MELQTNFQKQSLLRLNKLLGIEPRVRKDDKGKITGVSVIAEDGKFYLSATHGQMREGMEIVEWWFFDDPSPLPAACKAHHFTLRNQIHNALNWQKRKAK